MSFSARPLVPGPVHEAAARLAARAGFNGDAVVELGLEGLLLPTSAGGPGGTLHDAVAVIDAAARQGRHWPLVERCLLAPGWLAAAQGTAPGQAALAALSQGQLRPMTVTRRQGRAVATTADAQATHLLLADEGTTEATLWLLPLAAWPAIGPRREFLALDSRPTAEWEGMLPAASASPPADGAATVLARGAPLVAALQRAALWAQLAIAADTCAAMGALLEHTVNHLNGRQQFGVALATFQALRHRLVDAYAGYETLRGLVLQALRQAEAEPEGWGRAAPPGPALERAIRLAKFYAGHAGRQVAQQAIQLHGALGMSEELPAARLAKRLVANDFRFGDRLGQAQVLLAKPLTAAPQGAQPAQAVA